MTPQNRSLKYFMSYSIGSVRGMRKARRETHGMGFHPRPRSNKRPQTLSSQYESMIRLDNVSKQVGHQILFIEASAALQKGEKIGLVGPNGAGKTTLFRMISGREIPDEGQVLLDRGISIGYFSQDVGEMSGRSAVAEVMDGAGPVSVVAAELRELEAAMADPDKADEMDDIIARYGEVQHQFEELDGYALDGRAREALSGLGFSQEMMDGDVGKLSGGWKMRVALARILLMRPDVMLLDEPSNHLDLESLIWLEQFLKGYEGALLMTSHDREFINRIINKVVEIDGGQLTTYSGNYEFYEQQRALSDKQQQAQFERQRQCSPRRSSSSSVSRRAPRTPLKCRAASRSSTRSSGSSRRGGGRPWRSNSSRRRAPARTSSA
ncbi:ATPase subunit of ABC transporter with duplicated ATPase domains [Bradyrhizobium sp. USDA 4350]